MIDSVKELSAEDKEQNAPYHVGAIINLDIDAANAYFKKTPKPVYPVTWVLDQGEFEEDNDECGGVSGSRALSLLNGYHVGPHALWMWSRQRAGAKKGDYGITNRDLADTMRNVGALRFEDEPFSFKDGRDVIQDVTKWPPQGALILKAAEQATKPVYWVSAQIGRAHV